MSDKPVKQDLVYRLRQMAITYSRNPWHANLYTEAADEIERLREALATAYPSERELEQDRRP